MSSGRCIGLQAALERPVQRKEDSVSNGVSVSLDQLFQLALTGGTYNQRRLHDEATRYARTVTRKACRHLPPDLHEEIWQETFYALFRKGGSAIASCRPTTAFRRELFAAVRKVRSDYAAPGRRTRHSLVDEPSSQVAAEDVGRLLEAGQYERCLVPVRDTWEFDPDRAASPEAAQAIRQVEDRLTIDALLAPAPAQVSIALRLIHIEEEAVENVAASLGLSRFALHRRINRFTAGLRAAA